MGVFFFFLQCNCHSSKCISRLILVRLYMSSSTSLPLSCARQAPYPLCHLSGPKDFIVFRELPSDHSNSFTVRFISFVNFSWLLIHTPLSPLSPTVTDKHRCVLPLVCQLWTLYKQKHKAWDLSCLDFLLLYFSFEGHTNSGHVFVFVFLFHVFVFVFPLLSLTPVCVPADVRAASPCRAP